MSKSQREIVLATIPGESDQQRLIFATRLGGAAKPIVLRRESFNRDVGWFEQSSLELTREEMIGLRNSLGIRLPAACQQTVLTTQAAQDEQPRVLCFESALKRRA